jgi:hypothetical protein
MNRLNQEAQLALANLLCQKIALDLEAGDQSTLDPAIELLSEIEMEALLLAIRTQIGIERIIKYRLDERKDFNPLLISGF